jgi:hypothetical protein
MKFNEILAEEWKDSTKTRGEYNEVFINPTMKELQMVSQSQQYPEIRGFIVPNGDFYIMSGDNIIHEDILKFLSSKGYIPMVEFWYTKPDSVNKFIAVMSYIVLDQFVPSISYTQKVFDALKDVWDDYEKAFKRKNPNINLNLISI